MKRYFVALLVVLCVLGLCYMKYTDLQLVETTEDVGFDLETKTKLDNIDSQDSDNGSWTTYTNSRFGFQVKYPENLRIVEIGLSEESPDSGIDIYFEGDYCVSIAEFVSTVSYESGGASGQDFHTESGLTGLIYEKRKADKTTIYIKLGEEGTVGISMNDIPNEVFDRNWDLIQQIIDTITVNESNKIVS